MVVVTLLQMKMEIQIVPNMKLTQTSVKFMTMVVFKLKLSAVSVLEA